MESSIKNRVDMLLLRPYRIEIIQDEDEGGYIASCPDLPGCISMGDTAQAAVANLEDAKREWLTASLEMGNPIPDVDDLDHYSGQFKLRIPRSLHRELALRARDEGVSMNQYCVYLLSTNCGGRKLVEA